MQDERKKFVTISSPKKTKTIAQPVQNMEGALPWAPLHEHDAGGVLQLRCGEGVCRVLGGEGVSGRSLRCPGGRHQEDDACCLSQGAVEDAACLSMRAMGEQSQGFEACLSQKAMEEQNRVVEDYRRKRGAKRHNASVFSNRLM